MLTFTGIIPKNKIKHEELVKIEPGITGLEKMLPKASLSEITLVNCFANVNDTITDENKLQFQDKYGLTVIEDKPLTNQFSCLCEYGFREVSKEKAEDKLLEVWKVEALYRLDYELKNRRGITKKDVYEFSYYNGPLTSWPYWREHVLGVTTRMGISPLKLVYSPPPFSPNIKCISVSN